jgi:hypothetical protein
VSAFSTFIPTQSPSNVQGGGEDDVPPYGEVALLYPRGQTLITDDPRSCRQLLHQFIQPPRCSDDASLVYIFRGRYNSISVEQA